MRKILLAMLVVAVIGLLLFGCAPKPETPKITKISSTPKVTVKEPVSTEPSVPAEEPEVQEKPAVEPEQTPPVAEPVEAKKAVAPVTQEELDELKKGIQGIETEDLGGLSQ